MSANVSKALFALLALSPCVCSLASGAGIRGISPSGVNLMISQSAAHAWEKGESVCVIQAHQKLVCGKISIARDDSAEMKILTHHPNQIRDPVNGCLLPFLFEWQSQLEKTSEGQKIPAQRNFQVERAEPDTDFIAMANEYNLTACNVTRIARSPSARLGRFVDRSDRTKKQLPSSLNGIGDLRGLESLLASKFQSSFRAPTPVPSPSPPSVPSSGTPPASNTLSAASTPAAEPKEVEKAVEKPKEKTEERKPSSEDRPDGTGTTELKVSRSADLAVGINFVFPMMHYQQSLSKHFTLGLMSMLINYSSPNGPGGTLAGYGTLLTLNYYGESQFQGLWFALALGPNFVTTHFDGVEEKKTSMSISALLGWRWLQESGLNLGFGFGVNYFTSAAVNVGDRNKPLFLPGINLDVGFAF